MSEVLKQIGRQLLTQDNRCTANPMFCVQERVPVYGVTADYTEQFVWVDNEEGCEVEAPANGRETKRMRRVGVTHYWKTVMVAFTEAGCKQYLRLNGHNHRRETRIYAESFNRCPEMIAIRETLMEMAKEESK